MKLSDNFDREEFTCKCGCGQDTVDWGLLSIVEQVREHFGQPVTVTSGNRCVSWNQTVGGQPNSQHLKGKAADIVVQGVASREVADFIETILKEGGLGRYDTFTHVDARNKKARW